MSKVLSAGYDGIEVYLPPTETAGNKVFTDIIDRVRLDQPGFIFIAQELTAAGKDGLSDYISRLTSSLLELASYQPVHINAHCGKDYFSFDDNCRVIEAVLSISRKTGIPILFETHRGRFSFHAAALLPYLDKFPEMELVGDFSHFCTVSESLLEDQEEIMRQIIPRVSHLHARIGFEQGPQVNDPFAPEWQEHVAVFEQWWQQVIQDRKNKQPTLCITPEHGPSPYMPLLPFTREPLSDQWETNRQLMNRLKQLLKT